MHSELLKRVPLFEELSEGELEALSQVALLRTFPKDRVVIMAEEEGDSLFVIHDGQVKVSIVSEDGREVILSILGEGNFFGEMSLLDGEPHAASVIALEDTELSTMSQDEFDRVYEEMNPIMQGIIQLLLDRLRQSI